MRSQTFSHIRVTERLLLMLPTNCILRLTVDVLHKDTANCVEDFKWKVITELIQALQKRAQELDEKLSIEPNTVWFAGDGEPLD